MSMTQEDMNRFFATQGVGINNRNNQRVAASYRPDISLAQPNQPAYFSPTGGAASFLPQTNTGSSLGNYNLGSGPNLNGGGNAAFGEDLVGNVIDSRFDSGLADAGLETVGGASLDSINANTGPTSLGFNDIMKGFGQGAQGLASLAGIVNAYQQNKLQKKQFDANVASMNRNVKNQALALNNQINASNSLAAQMGSGVVKERVDGSRVA